jgi:hypothetical protein
MALVRATDCITYYRQQVFLGGNLSQFSLPMFLLARIEH